MHWKRVAVLSSLVAMLVGCGKSASPGLEHEWSEKLPEDLRAEQAIIVKDVVYSSNFGLSMGGSEAPPVIAAFDLNTRKLSWLIEEKPLIPMASDGKRLFVVTDREIVAISTEDGSMLWQTNLALEDGYSRLDELLLRDEWLFFSHHKDQTSELYALDAQTGSFVWTVSLDAPMDWFRPVAGPVHWSEHRVVAYDRGRLYVRMALEVRGAKENYQFVLMALDARDGRELWSFPFEVPIIQGDGPPGAASRLAFDEQVVYFSTFGGISYALDQDTGEMLWKREARFDYPVHMNGQIIAISDYQTVGALDAQTGDLEWAVPFIDSGIGSLSPFVFLDSYLVFYSSNDEGGQLSVVESGEVIFKLFPDFPRYCAPLSPVALAARDEHLYLITPNCVHSFQVSWRSRGSTRPPSASWAHNLTASADCCMLVGGTTTRRQGVS